MTEIWLELLRRIMGTYLLAEVVMLQASISAVLGGCSGADGKRRPVLNATDRAIGGDDIGSNDVLSFWPRSQCTPCLL